MKTNSPLARKIIIISCGLVTLGFFAILAPVVCDTHEGARCADATACWAALSVPPAGARSCGWHPRRARRSLRPRRSTANAPSLVRTRQDAWHARSVARVGSSET
jgi:hypothetical protein